MPNRIVQAGFISIAKSAYHNSAILTGKLAMDIAGNAEYLKGVIDERTSEGVVTPFAGHDHTGGRLGAPINRYIGVIPQSSNALWSSNQNTGDWLGFSTKPHDIYFYVPPGIDRAAISIMYVAPDNVDPTLQSEIGLSAGDDTPTVIVDIDDVVAARTWSAEVNINVIPATLNVFKLWRRETAPGGMALLEIFAAAIREYTTVT